jgi:hypothetical protein
VWFEATGTWPTRREHVHHKDGNKLNNDLSNLILLPARTHHALHPETEIGKKLNGEFHKEFSKTRQRDQKGKFI